MEGLVRDRRRRVTKAEAVRSALEEEELQSTVKMREREIPCQTKKKKNHLTKCILLSPLCGIFLRMFLRKSCGRDWLPNTSSFQRQIFMNISRRRLSDCLTGSSVIIFSSPFHHSPTPLLFFFLNTNKTFWYVSVPHE